MSLNPGVTMVPPSRERQPPVVVALVVAGLLVLAFVFGYYVL